MSTDLQNPDIDTPEPTLSTLMAGIIADVEKLVAQQMALLKREVQEDVRAAGAATAMVAFGGSVVLIAGVMLSIAAAYAIQSASNWSMESCYTLVGVCLAVVGGLMLWGGAQLFSAINPVPTRSMEALQENVQCLTQPETCQIPQHPKTSSVK